MNVAFADVAGELDRILNGPSTPKVLSFDVFDTLLHRRCSREFVKDHVVRRFSEALRARGVAESMPILPARLRAESELFDHAAARGHDPEFHIFARNPRWVELVAGEQLGSHERADLARWLEQIEVDAERLAVRANDAMRATVQAVRGRVDRLVFASDMYLGRRHVSALLDSCGYGGLFDAGYVSGDLEAYKATGRMFTLMAEAEGVAVEDIVHLGDDEAADLHGPRLAGARALWIDERELRARRAREIADHDGVLADRRLLPLVVDRFAHQGLEAPRSFAEDYGRTVFGPIFANFVHDVISKAQGAGISALFFLSRDGFAFQRVYDAMVRSTVGRGGPPLPSRYICLSRLPVLRAMLQDGLSLKAVMSAKNHLVLPSRSVGNVFASLGLDPTMIACLAQRHGVGPAEFFSDGMLHAPPMLNLLNDRELARHARQVGTEAAGVVRDYLRQEGFFDFERVGLVDIGWGATIQDQLRDCIMDEPDRPTMVGYYFGGNQSLYDRRTPDNWMEPLVASVFSPEAELPLGNASTFSFVGLMEEAARAPHGTCYAYRRDGDAVVPLLRADALRPAEAAAEPALCRLQQGIVDYAGEYAAAVGLLDVTPTEMRTLANTALQRLVLYPEPREIQFWQDVHHTNDVGGVLEIDELLVTPARPGWRRPWRWRRTARGSMWTFGSIRYLLGALGLLLYNVGWSASKSRKVQAPMNRQRLRAPYYFCNESRRPPSRQPGELEQSAVFREAAARSERFVAGHRESLGDRVTLLTPLFASGTTAVLQANRRLPARLYAGFRIVNDGLPLNAVLDRGVKRPLVERLDAHPRARRSARRLAELRRRR